jgi:protocatechuate 3,4-dioxygenase beta subunit
LGAFGAAGYTDSTGQTFLRGLETTDGSGRVTFRTIYPGCYLGRATHIHVKIFINDAVIKTTQVAFPEHVASSVYRSGIYAAHGQSTTSNASDNVFSDGTSSEMATPTGDTATVTRRR